MDEHRDFDEIERFSDSSSDLEGAVGGIGPYKYEPYLQDGDPDVVNAFTTQNMTPDVPKDIGRLQNVEWCKCGKCTSMPTVEESICCHEQEMVCRKKDSKGTIICITEHVGFAPVCLNEDVLETAYHNFRQFYKEEFGNEWKRYTAYRQFVSWCYKYLGARVRVPIPSCVVTAIRQKFFSIDFTGFKDT